MSPGAHLSPYLSEVLGRAGLEAARLFATEASIEHLLSALLADEDAALHQLVLHAFADPETIGADILALSPGILVVASGATLPFSPLGIEAAHHAREAARTAGRSEVTLVHLLAGALNALPEDAHDALNAAGMDREKLEAACASSGTAGEFEVSAHLFHPFTADARQALSKAAHAACRADESSIGPARLVLAALAGDEELEERSGLSRSRASLVLEGRTADPSPPPTAGLAPGAELTEFLNALPARAGSLDVLEALHRDPESELTLAFTRQKVSPRLLEHARGSFGDP